jgi:hypothetical protein
MALFLNTRGNSTLGIGICSRCSIKMPLHKLNPDPNSPGLRSGIWVPGPKTSSIFPRLAGTRTGGRMAMEARSER